MSNGNLVQATSPSDDPECDHLTPAEYVENLKTFARRCFEVSFEGGDVDGATLQEWGVELGLLKETEATEEDCRNHWCDLEPGDTWYRFSDHPSASEDGK